MSESCSWCGSAAVVPVVFGLPGGELRSAAEADHVVLGGCLVPEDPPDRQCRRCGHRWSSLDEALAEHDGWNELAGEAAVLFPEPGQRAWGREAWRVLARRARIGPDPATRRGQLVALALVHREFSARAFGGPPPGRADPDAVAAYPAVTADLADAVGDGPLFAGLWLSGWPEMAYPLTDADVEAALTVDPPGEQRVARYRRARFWVTEGMPRA